MTDDQNHGQRRWIDEAEEALNRAGESLRAAWDQTRDARMSALETAKEAANRLGEVIDQGIEVARQTWDPSGKESAAAGSPDASAASATEPPTTAEEEE